MEGVVLVDTYKFRGGSCGLRRVLLLFPAPIVTLTFFFNSAALHSMPQISGVCLLKTGGYDNKKRGDDNKKIPREIC